MPAATVKTIAYADEVAALTSDAPADIGSTAAAGDGTTAARSNHVHEIGSGAVGDTIKLAAGVIDFQAVPVAAPGPTELVKGMVYMDGTTLKAVTVSYSA